jgi:hypothetical protein
LTASPAPSPAGARARPVWPTGRSSSGRHRPAQRPGTNSKLTCNEAWPVVGSRRLRETLPRTARRRLLRQRSALYGPVGRARLVSVGVAGPRNDVDAMSTRCRRRGRG